MAYLNFRYDVDEDGIVLLAWDMPDRSMNVFTQQVIDELTLIVDRVITDPTVKGVVFTSLKESFSAGADLGMLHSLMQNYAAEKRVNEEKAARTLFEMAGQHAARRGWRRLMVCVWAARLSLRFLAMCVLSLIIQKLSSLFLR
jgi:3-hydroxyacyl-CoA dehydrogenase / enoyl-CoA hydratase / 3-hydroxybutyryl-CoA epimerase